MKAVLADRHHADLWWSLSLLFEKRLGWKLWCPYGMNWYDKGYFRFYGDLRKEDPYRFIAKQYLEDTIFKRPNGEMVLRETYEGCLDYPKPNLLTFEEFKETPIDIILCSVHENEEYFAKLKEFQPKAKFIRQVGNELDSLVNHELYPNLLSSATKPFNEFQGKNKVLYRQEFDLNLFKYEPPRFFRNLWSFQNDLGQFPEAWEWWLRLKHNLPDFYFQSFGVTNEQGKIYSKRDFVKKMLEASFHFIVKDWDGYGHAIHNAIALGRPVITKGEYYKGRLADPLLEDGETCLFIDNDVSPVEERIKYWSKPENLRKMCEKAYRRFCEVVDFDEEFKQIKEFLENLK